MLAEQLDLAPSRPYVLVAAETYCFQTESK